MYDQPEKALTLRSGITQSFCVFFIVADVQK